MIKAYRAIERTYICGELENEYKLDKVLYSEDEYKNYKPLVFEYKSIESIEKWHEEEFHDNFCARVKILYPIFGTKFRGLYSSQTDKFYKLKDHPNFSVVVIYSLEETSITLKEIMKMDSEKAIQYLLERGIRCINELT